MTDQDRLSGPRTEAWTTYPSLSSPPLALILCNDREAGLGKLTLKRNKAALPFAGKYRLIDFALSNCVNSQLETVGVVAQYEPRSLHAHLAYGRPWDLDRRQGGLAVLQPYQVRSGVNWYRGSADALYQNLDFVFHHRVDQVLILAGGQVHSLDFGPMIARHRETKADLTVAVVSAPEEVQRRHTTLIADTDGWIHDVLPPGAKAPGSLVLIGALLFSVDTLSWRLSEDAQRESSDHDLLGDIIPRMVQAGDRVTAYLHTGYWHGLQTAYEYWLAHMDLVRERSDLNLQDAAWPVRTQPMILPPTRVSAGGRMSHSLVCEGCIIDGTVEYSVLSPGVYVAPGAVVRNAVVMHNTSIEERATVENAIVDMNVTVGPQAQVGQVDRHAPTLSPSTLTRLAVVEMGSRIPAHTVVPPDEPKEQWVLSPQRQDVSSAPADAGS